jgi:hypothetical protein
VDQELDINAVADRAEVASQPAVEMFHDPDPIKVRSQREILCLLYFHLLLDHQRAILLLVRAGIDGPAFALHRPFEEALLRMYLSICGSDAEFEALQKGRYQTDFAKLGDQLGARLGAGTLLGDWYRGSLRTMHGYTHGGPEQIFRYCNEHGEVESTYSKTERCSLIYQTVFIVNIAAFWAGRSLRREPQAVLVNESFVEFVKKEPKLLDMLREAGLQNSDLGTLDR